MSPPCRRLLSGSGWTCRWKVSHHKLRAYPDAHGAAPTVIPACSPSPHELGGLNQTLRTPPDVSCVVSSGSADSNPCGRTALAPGLALFDRGLGADALSAWRRSERVPATGTYNRGSSCPKQIVFSPPGKGRGPKPR